MLTDTQKLERRNHELLILNTIAEALNRELNINAAVNVVLAKVAELLDLQTGWAWLLDLQTSETYLAAAQNLPPALADYPERLQGSCYCLRTYQEGDLAGAANINVVTCSRLEFLMQGTEGLTYHASIPLYSYDRQKKLGVLNVASRDWCELSDEDLRLLHTVGDLLGMAIERALLFEKSRQLGATEERNRLARDIHDTLAQGLAGIAMQLETMDALLEVDTSREKLQGIVRRTLELTRRNLEEARRSVLDLRAAPLDNRSLPEALQALAEEMEGMQINFEVTDGSRPLSVRLETGLYRIAQEALN
ncbi:MAG: GAF domain-containing protein, partial [Anaerolineae bacterium]|nr:GAF domain-containing protein [Anaerolineae bacterium]